MVIHAFRPPAIQRSNKVVKSAVVAAGSGPGQALSSTLARTLPLSMLAQRGVGASTQWAWLACLQPTCDETWWCRGGEVFRGELNRENTELSKDT